MGSTFGMYTSTIRHNWKKAKDTQNYEVSTTYTLYVQSKMKRTWRKMKINYSLHTKHNTEQQHTRSECGFEGKQSLQFLWVASVLCFYIIPDDFAFNSTAEHKLALFHWHCDGSRIVPTIAAEHRARSGTVRPNIAESMAGTKHPP